MKDEISRDCVSPLYHLPAALRIVIESFLPPEKSKPKGGRPRESDLKMMTAIFYLLRTGCQWKAIPRCLGASSTVHDRLEEWIRQGIFQKAFRAGLIFFDELKGIDWEWQAMDAAMTKAPLGGEDTGANPTDRGKKGVKRSILVEGHGVPLGVVVSKANRNDMKLTEATLKSSVTKRPDPEVIHQNMCLDKGYDYPEVREIVDEWGYTAHIKTRGEEKTEKQRIPGYRARRWVVEATHSWMNRFRSLLIRWEKKTENYLGMVHLACAFICLNASGVFG
jgi:putative transposase